MLNPLVLGRFLDRYFKVLWGPNFLIFFHRDIRNKKVCKVKNFQVWVVSWYSSKRHRRREGGAYSAPYPLCFKGLTMIKYRVSWKKAHVFWTTVVKEICTYFWLPKYLLPADERYQYSSTISMLTVKQYFLMNELFWKIALKTKILNSDFSVWPCVQWIISTSFVLN